MPPGLRAEFTKRYSILVGESQCGVVVMKMNRLTLTRLMHMPVPKLVCGVACAPSFASSMDGDVPRDTASTVQKARRSSHG
jgi:hypothetical protein